MLLLNNNNNDGEADYKYPWETGDNTVMLATYTADRVIYIANANSPTCYNQKATPSWTAEYTGNDQWTVVKKCMLRPGYAVSAETWTFYENTGKLVSSWNK